MQLKAVFPHSAGFVLAFEYMLSDLAEVLRHAQRPLAQAQVKSYLQMLLKGIAFCHAKNNCALGQFQHGLGWDLGDHDVGHAWRGDKGGRPMCEWPGV